MIAEMTRNFECRCPKCNKQLMQILNLQPKDAAPEAYLAKFTCATIKCMRCSWVGGVNSLVIVQAKGNIEFSDKPIIQIGVKTERQRAP